MKTAIRPNLFVVGAPKCGTTSFCYYLQQHPNIFFSRQKEPLFFCDANEHQERWRAKTLDDYLALYAGSESYRWRGDGSVWYLSSRAAADRIKAFSPDAKILIFLRNPVDLVVSLHNQFLDSGNENIRDFEGAYRASNARRMGRRLPKRAHYKRGLLYDEVARNCEQVAYYRDLFGDEAVKVVLFDDLKRDLPGVYRETLEYLGLDPAFQPDFTQKNLRKQIRNFTLQRLLRKHYFDLSHAVNSIPFEWLRHGLNWRLQHLRQWLLQVNLIDADKDKQESLSPAIREKLREDYYDEVQCLERLTGRDLSAWRAKNGWLDQSSLSA